MAEDKEGMEWWSVRVRGEGEWPDQLYFFCLAASSAHQEMSCRWRAFACHAEGLSTVYHDPPSQLLYGYHEWDLRHTVDVVKASELWESAPLRITTEETETESPARKIPTGATFDGHRPTTIEEMLQEAEKAIRCEVKDLQAGDDPGYAGIVAVAIRLVANICHRLEALALVREDAIRDGLSRMQIMALHPEGSSVMDEQGFVGDVLHGVDEVGEVAYIRWVGSLEPDRIVAPGCETESGRKFERVEP